MKQYQRAALALVVAKLEFGNTKSNIYDYNESLYPQISGNGREFNLYDYGHSEFISLKKKGVKKYEGYHYGNSSYFEITISGSTINFYDFSTAQYYRFS